MNKKFFCEFYAESWHFQEWCKLNKISCANIKVQDSVIDSIQKRHSGPAVYFLKPKTVFLLAKELSESGNTNFLKDKKIICGAGWHDSITPYQNDIIYFFEKNFSEWANICKVFEKKIILLADGYPSTRLTDLKVFDVVVFNLEFLYYANTYLESMLDRNPTKDFLYLTMDKDTRSHRDLVYSLLTQDTVFSNSICQKNKRNNSQRFKDLVESYGTGLYELGHNWYDRYPSLGYYADTNFEIVAETFGQLGNDAFFPTEKIIKPLVMKHPFVVAGSKGFLKNLRELGFKTFAEFIDESYDNIHDWTGRMKTMVAVVKDIITKGSEQFYNDTRTVCEHNYNVLCDLQGRHKNVLWKNMKTVMDKINEY